MIDLKSGFWHTELDEPSSYLTTTATPYGTFRWKRMPFGISPSPEEFARRFPDELQGLPGEVSIVDDILDYGGSIKNHDKHLEGLHRRCRERKITLNHEKAVLRQQEVRYVGLILITQGIEQDQSAMKEMPDPTDKKGV